MVYNKVFHTESHDVCFTKSSIFNNLTLLVSSNKTFLPHDRTFQIITIVDLLLKKTLVIIQNVEQIESV